MLPVIRAGCIRSRMVIPRFSNDTAAHGSCWVIDTVQYLSGYNSSNPIHSQSALSFDNATGDLCFTPVQIENSVWALVISEYRNGVLIGQVERDIQLRLQPDPVPTIFNLVSGLMEVSGESECMSGFLSKLLLRRPWCKCSGRFNHELGSRNAIWTNNTSTNSNYDTAFFQLDPTLADVSTSSLYYSKAFTTVIVLIPLLRYVNIALLYYRSLIHFCINPEFSNQRQTWV